MLRLLKNIFFKIIYILVIIYLAIFIPNVWGEKPLVIVSGSMEPILKVGGILYYKSIPLNSFKEGDILVYNIPEHIVSHRVIYHNDDFFITKGDVNNAYDEIVYNNQIMGKSNNWSIPFLGYYASFISNNKYLLVISLVLVLIDIVANKNGDRDYEKK
jgi:signal peptidase I